MKRALIAAALAAIAAPALADTPEQRLDALDKRITRLEDMNAVEKVQRAYGYFVDKGQWTQLSELFADDATLEIGGKGLFLGKKRVLEYMQTAFGKDGPKEGLLANHMQFQPIVDIAPDGKTAWVRSRAFVMSVGGWGLPLYEDEFTKENGVWKFKRESGPFTMYSSWKGWGHDALNNTWPDKFDPPPDLPPTHGLPDLSGVLDRAVPLSQPGDRQAIPGRAGRRLPGPAGHARAGGLAARSAASPTAPSRSREPPKD